MGFTMPKNFAKADLIGWNCEILFISLPKYSPFYSLHIPMSWLVIYIPYLLNIFFGWDLQLSPVESVECCFTILISWIPIADAEKSLVLDGSAMLNPYLSLLVIVKFLFLMLSFSQFLANSQAMVAPAKEAFATRVMVWQIPHVYESMEDDEVND